jgi:hypothetical protein
MCYSRKIWENLLRKTEAQNGCLANDYDYDIFCQILSQSFLKLDPQFASIIPEEKY